MDIHDVPGLSDEQILELWIRGVVEQRFETLLRDELGAEEVVL